MQVNVKPGAKQSQITGVNENVLHMRLAAAPIDGAANIALLLLLSERLSLRRSSLSVIRGATSRNKTVSIDTAANDGLTVDALHARVQQAVPLSDSEEE